MLIGKLNQRVSFWVYEKFRDSSGFSVTEWREKGRFWAEIITIGGEEGRIAAAQSSTVRYRVRLRYRRDILPSMMLKLLDDGGRFLHIRAVRDPDGRREILELPCDWSQGQTEPK